MCKETPPPNPSANDKTVLPKRNYFFIPIISAYSYRYDKFNTATNLEFYNIYIFRQDKIIKL